MAGLPPVSGSDDSVAAYPHLGTEFAAEREEIGKADAGLASEPWGVRGLLHELDALVARMLQAKQEAFDLEIKLTADNVRLREALREFVEAEWMVTHDWGGDREAVLRKAYEAIGKDWDRG